MTSKDFKVTCGFIVALGLWYAIGYMQGYEAGETFGENLGYREGKKDGANEAGRVGADTASGS